MEYDYSKDAIIRLARQCLLLGKQERPELIWLKEKCRLIQEKYQLRTKSDTDTWLYRKMYGRSPDRESDLLKIRFWRTGRHLPLNRRLCLLFGEALELSPEEMRYLIQNYYDHSLYLFSDTADFSTELYRKNYTLMQELANSFLSRTSDARLQFLNISRDALSHNLRHVYYTASFDYVHMKLSKARRTELTMHITSISYCSELTRLLKLHGEFPRRTMLRHLIFCNLPDLSLSRLNDQLFQLGFLPLQEDHTLAGGEHLDWLLVRLLQIYEDLRKEKDTDFCQTWFANACCTLDQFFAEQNCPALRFMYYKALEE